MTRPDSHRATGVEFTSIRTGNLMAQDGKGFLRAFFVLLRMYAAVGLALLVVGLVCMVLLGYALYRESHGF